MDYNNTYTYWDKAFNTSSERDTPVLHLLTSNKKYTEIA